MTTRELKKSEEKMMGRGSTLIDSAKLKGGVTIVVLRMRPVSVPPFTDMGETRVVIHTPNGRMSGIASTQFDRSSAT